MEERTDWQEDLDNLLDAVVDPTPRPVEPWGQRPPPPPPEPIMDPHDMISEWGSGD